MRARLHAWLSLALLIAAAWVHAASARAQDADAAEAGAAAEPNAEPPSEGEAAPEDADDGDRSTPIAASGQPFERARVVVSVGAGVGTLSLVRPTDAGRQRLPRSAFAAAELGVRLHLSPESRLSLEVALDYLSSLGFALRSEPLFALSQRVDVRAQRVELALAPRLRLGDSRDSLSLALPVGFVLRSVVPDLHQFGLPNFVLAGPELRLELLAPLGERVRVRIGPELQWLAIVDATLRDRGACCQGVSVGGQASLEGSMGDAFSVSLSVREAHAFVGSGPRAYSDVERFVTAVVGGRL